MCRYFISGGLTMIALAIKGFLLRYVTDTWELKQRRRQRQRKRHLKIYLYFIRATLRLFQFGQLLQKWRTIQEPNW